MSDPWNAAWLEAEATAPPQLEVFPTLEFRHPVFVDDVTGPFAMRVVALTSVDQTFGIEADGVMDAGTEQLFKAVTFMAERPEFTEGKTPECAITLDNVAREMVPYLEAAVAMRADMEVTYREYRSDDLTAPCYGPVTFTIKKVSVNGTQLKATAKIEDLANRKFPSQVYTTIEYPALQN
jgi:hypothetical protein